MNIYILKTLHSFYKMKEIIINPQLFNNTYNIPFIQEAYNAKEQYTNYNKADKIIYCFWTGDNKITANRQKSLDVLSKIANVEIKLITPSNLKYYINKVGKPLHPAYNYLSLVHRADYLRAYFMYNLGGGYTDIKQTTTNWDKLFNKLNNNDNCFALGYPENKPTDIGYVNDFFNTYDALKINTLMYLDFYNIIGNGSYIFKPKSYFAKLWLCETERRLTIKYNELTKNPGNILGDNKGYPLPWTSILGQIFHPLSYIYKKQILKSHLIRPTCENYR